MATDAAITSDGYARKLVECILKGEATRPQDLSALFLRARETSFRRSSVEEVGHFVAHHAQRERGVAFVAVQSSIAAAFPPLPFGPRSLLRIARRPDFQRLIRQFNKQLTDELCVSELGVARHVVFRQMIKALLAFRHQPDPHDKKLFEWLLKMLPLDAPLSGERISADLIQQMVDLGWLLGSERDEMRKRRPDIALYVISVMHGSTLRLPDRSAPLVVTQDRQGCLTVVAKLPVLGSSMPLCDVPALRTKESAARCCEPKLFEKLGETYDPIELHEGKLVLR